MSNSSGRGVPPPNSANKAPLTGLPCTWWRYKIEERRYSGRSRSLVDRSKRYQRRAVLAG